VIRARENRLISQMSTLSITIWNSAPKAFPLELGGYAARAARKGMAGLPASDATARSGQGLALAAAGGDLDQAVGGVVLVASQVPPGEPVDGVVGVGRGPIPGQLPSQIPAVAEVQDRAIGPAAV
jgi:hypothetical protein